MKYTIIYFFILLFILSLPTEINLLINNENDIPQAMFYIQVLVLYPIIMIFFGLSIVSLITGCFVYVSKLLKRKLRFQLLWKLTIFSLTKPVLIYVIFVLILENNTFVNLLITILLAFTMYRIIMGFPKRRSQEQSLLFYLWGNLNTN